MKKHLLFCTFLALLGWCVCPQTWANGVKVGELYYILNTNGTATVTYPGDVNIADKTSEYFGDIVIPESINVDGQDYNVTEIDGNAFSHSAITSIIVGDNVTKVNGDAFAYTSTLTSVTFGAKVSFIGQGTTWGSNNVANVYLKSNTPASTLGAYNFSNATLHVSSEALYAYSNNNTWKNYSYKVEKDGIYYNLNFANKTASVTCVCDKEPASADENPYSGNIVIPEIIEFGDDSYTVTEIGKNAFFRSNITSIILPGSIKTIARAALGRTQITDITIPDNVEILDFDAFGYNSKMNAVTIGASVKTLSQGVFYSTPIKNVYFRGTTPPTSIASVYVFSSSPTGHVLASALDTYNAASNLTKFMLNTEFVGDADTKFASDQHAKALLVERLAAFASEKEYIEENASHFDANKVAAFIAAYGNVPAYATNDVIYNAGIYDEFSFGITRAYSAMFSPVRASINTINQDHLYLVEAANISALKGYYLKGQPEVATKGTAAYIYSVGLNDNSYWHFVPSGKTDSNYGDIATYYLKMATKDYYLGYNNGSSNDGRSLAPTTGTAYDFAILSTTAAKIPFKSGQGFDSKSVVFYNTEKNISLGANTTLTNTMVWQWAPDKNKDYHPWNIYDATPITSTEESKAILSQIIAEYSCLANDPGRYVASEGLIAALNNAKTLAASATMTERYMAIDAIIKAYEASDKIDTNPITAGYYYIVSAGYGPGISDGPYDYEGKNAFYNDGDVVKWKAFDPNDLSFVYYISSSGEKWNVYSIKEKTYIKRGVSSYSCNVATSVTPENAQTFTEMEVGSGKFAMKGSTYVYAMTTSHNGSNLASDNLNVWGSENEAKSYGINQWYLHKVPQEIIDGFTEIIVENGAATINTSGVLTEAEYVATLAKVDATSITSLDLSNTGVNVATLNPTQIKNSALGANTVYYLPTDYAASMPNFVIDGNCNILLLADKENFVPASSFTANQAIYNKTISDGGWYSCVLPYAIKVPAGVTVLNNATVNGSSISFAEVEEGATIEANTPFLYKTANGNVAFNATNAAINTEVGESGALKGTYTKIAKGSATGKLILNAAGSAFATATANASIPAFRAYLDAQSSGSNTFTITIGDDLTGIVGADADLNAKVDVYTIDGKLVRQGVEAITALQGLEKGTYIVNGTKIKK